jgi:hypothetical protein
MREQTIREPKPMTLHSVTKLEPEEEKIREKPAPQFTDERDYLILYCEAILEYFSASILANTIGRESLARIGAAISSCRQHHKHNKKNQIAVSTCS